MQQRDAHSRLTGWPQGRETVHPDPLPSVTQRGRKLGRAARTPPVAWKQVEWVHMAREGRRRTRRRTAVIVLVAVLVVAAAGVAGGGPTARPLRPRPWPRQLVAASTETVKETVSATGTIQPATQANLKFAQGGKVTAVNVKVGDTVTAGQALGTIDATTLTAALTLAQQQLTAAQAQLTAATTAANAQQIASANAQVDLDPDQGDLGPAGAGPVDADLDHRGHGRGGQRRRRRHRRGGTSTSGSSAAPGSSGAGGASPVRRRRPRAAAPRRRRPRPSSSSSRPTRGSSTRPSARPTSPS